MSPVEHQPALAGPHDLYLEQCLLGVPLIYGNATHLGELLAAVDAADLYNPAHGLIWRAVGDLYQQGAPIDTPAIIGRLADAGAIDAAGGEVALVDIASVAVPWPSVGWQHHAQRLLDLAERRRLMASAAAAREFAADLTTDLGDVRDGLRDALGSMAVAGGSDARDWLDVADDDTPPPPWLVPGLIREGHRAIIVGEEGSGKTVLLRQILLAASAGLHPFARQHPARPTRHRIRPLTTLTIDLENPPDQIEAVGRQLRQAIHGDGVPPDQWRGRAFVLARPGGIDLRSRSGRGLVERALLEIQPDLVGLGPIYKAADPPGRGENDEVVAAHVQKVLDDFRTRYGFGLLLEHHAPHGSGASREIRPYGSSLWLRWPELGLGLVMGDNRRDQQVGRWRGDRVKVAWPDRVVWGQAWPFEGVYASGVDQCPDSLTPAAVDPGEF